MIRGYSENGGKRGRNKEKIWGKDREERNLTTEKNKKQTKQMKKDKINE